MVNFLDLEGVDPASATREAAESITKARREVEVKGIKSFLFHSASTEEFDQRVQFGEVEEVLDGIADEYLGSPGERAKLLSALRREFEAQYAPAADEDEDDETLGPCGCIDYHMADCPLRGGAASESSYDDPNDYDGPDDDWRAYSKVSVNKSCSICEKPVGELRNDTSMREAAISGMCQGCQDDFFGSEPKVEKVAAVEVEEPPAVEQPKDQLPVWIRDSITENKER